MSPDDTSDGGAARNPAQGRAAVLYLEEDGETVVFDTHGFNEEVNRLLRQVLTSDTDPHAFSAFHELAVAKSSRRYASIVARALVGRWAEYIAFDCETWQIPGQLKRLNTFSLLLRSLEVDHPLAKGDRS